MEEIISILVMVAIFVTIACVIIKVIGFAIQSFLAILIVGGLFMLGFWLLTMCAGTLTSIYQYPAYNLLLKL